MKNKICLIMLFAMLFVCVFAVAVSAETTSNGTAIPDWTDVIRYETGDNAIAYKDGFDTTARVLLDNGDGTYSTYPTNYIIKGTDSVFTVSTELNFAALNAATGKNYSYASVIRFEMPVGYTSVDARAFKIDKNFKSLQTVKVCEGVITMGDYVFYQSTTVVEIELPSTLETIGTEFAYSATALETINIPKNLTSITTKAFSGCSKLTTVDFSKSEKLESIGGYAFYRCYLLESAIFPEGLKSLGEFSFKESGVKEVYLPSTLETISENKVFAECSRLTTITSKSTFIAKNMFLSCNNIQSLTLTNTIEIGNNAFAAYYGDQSGARSSFSNLVLPDTLTSIGEYAFSKHSIQSVIIPAKVTKIGQKAFQLNAPLEKVVILGTTIGSGMFSSCTNLTTLVLTDKFETFGSGAFDATDTCTTFYVGSQENATKLSSITNAPNKIKNAKISSYDDYKAGTHTQSSYILIYGANLCDVAYGEHNIPEPTYYFTSYTEESSVKGVCTRCGIEEIKETVEPLFTCLGFSAPDDSVGGISIGFRVDHIAISAYERITKSKVSYGLFVGVYEKLGNEDVINLETGEIAEDAVVADLSEGGFVLLKLKIAGFTTDEQKASMFAVGTYVINGDKISYVQAEKPTEGQKYYYTSYNNIVK